MRGPDLSAVRDAQRAYRRRPCWRWRATRRASSSSGCTAWARRCTRSCARRAGDAAAGSTRRSGRTATCSPTWCGGCWRTGRTRPSSTRSSTRTLAPEEIAADPLAEVEAFGDAVANPGIAAPGGAVRAAGATRAGWNVNEPASVAPLIAAREAWRAHRWPAAADAARRAARRGARGGEPGGSRSTSSATVARGDAGGGGGGARGGAAAAFPDWSARPAADRARGAAPGGRPLRGERGGTDGARHARGRQDAGRRDRANCARRSTSCATTPTRPRRRPGGAAA